MPRPKPCIGDVAVIVGEPPRDRCGNANPYLGASLLGPLRERLLVALRDGGDTSGYTFWYAPAYGGAYRIESVEDVNWETMRR